MDLEKQKNHLLPLKHRIPYLTTSAERDLYRQTHNQNSGVVFQLVSLRKGRDQMYWIFSEEQNLGTSKGNLFQKNNEAQG